MIYWWVVITVCVFFIGYMVGVDRGVRAEHTRSLKRQAKQQKALIRPNKGLHLVKEAKPRE